MGYYTTYGIEIDGYNGNESTIDFVGNQIGDWNPFYEECKWYDHEEDMKKISMKYPDMVFHLYGEGEQNGDIWYKHFKNGKMQECKAKIIFEPYDETKLK